MVTDCDGSAGGEGASAFLGAIFDGADFGATLAVLKFVADWARAAGLSMEWRTSKSATMDSLEGKCERSGFAATGTAIDDVRGTGRFMRVVKGGHGGCKPPSGLVFPCGVGDLQVHEGGMGGDGIHLEFLELELGHAGLQLEKRALQSAIGSAEGDADLG